MSINKVILVGRLGKDPEVKTTPSGQTLAKFSLATDEKFTDKSGQRQEKTEWHNIIVWGKLAEICGNYLRKGKLVYIEGSIKTDSWDDKETGAKKYRTEIIASEMRMLGTKSEDDRSGGGNRDYAPAGARSSGTNSGADFVEDDDEVPF
jgi:single-strand DNA-binding protein